MNSPLSINDFRERLELNTKIGDPKIKGSPLAIFTVFGQNKKLLYGEFDNRKFRLTRNKFVPKTPFLIEGLYKSKNKFETEIDIKIKPNGFGYYWLLYFPTIGIVLFNYILLTKGHDLETSVFIIGNLFLLPMFIPSLTFKRKKKKLTNEFYRLFEITEEQAI